MTTPSPDPCSHRTSYRATAYCSACDHIIEIAGPSMEALGGVCDRCGGFLVELAGEWLPGSADERRDRDEDCQP